jgi:hypothetical protein
MDMSLAIPQLTSDAMKREVDRLLPSASVTTETINPDYKSWRLRVRLGTLDVEYAWGPLSGFGGSDLARPQTQDDTPFDYADEMFESLEEALAFLQKMIVKYKL